MKGAEMPDDFLTESVVDILQVLTFSIELNEGVEDPDQIQETTARFSAGAFASFVSIYADLVNEALVHSVDDGWCDADLVDELYDEELNLLRDRFKELSFFMAGRLRGILENPPQRARERGVEIPTEPTPTELELLRAEILGPDEDLLGDIIEDRIDAMLDIDEPLEFDRECYTLVAEAFEMMARSYAELLYRQLAIAVQNGYLDAEVIHDERREDLRELAAKLAGVGAFMARNLRAI